MRMSACQANELHKSLELETTNQTFLWVAHTHTHTHSVSGAWAGKLQRMIERARNSAALLLLTFWGEQKSMILIDRGET